MKILMVNKFLYPNGGSETYIFKLGEELIRQGHQVQYFGMEHEGRIVGNAAEQYTSGMDFHTGKLQKLLYPFKIIYSKEAYRKLQKVLDDFAPDVVHLNNINFQLTPSVIYAVQDWEKAHLAEHGPVRIVFTAHDYQWICPNHMLQDPATRQVCYRCQDGHFWECTKHKCIHGSTVKSVLGSLEAMYYKARETYELVDLIISPSEFLAKKLSDYPGLEPKIVTLHNFIDSCNVEVPKEDYILYFGRYAVEKGVETLLSVCRELPQISFKFAGGGPLEDAVNACPNVENLGFLQGQDMVETIAAAKLVIFPSEWYENCPFSVMEAQMYGTPILASDIGGVPELVQNHVTGELFEAGNAQDLREKLQSFLENEEALQQYTANCKAVVFDSVEAYTKKYLQLISKL